MILQKNADRLYDYLFCLFILVLPYSFKFPNILLIVIAAFFLLDIKRSKKVRFDVLKNPSLLILATLCVYWIAKGIVTQSISETKYSLLLSVFLIPVLFLKITNVNRILIAISISGFLVTARATYALASYFITYHQMLPFEGETINNVLHMERPYLGYFAVFTLIVTFHLSTVLKKYRYLLWVHCLYLTVFILLISARISTITVFILIALYLLVYSRMKTKYKVYTVAGSMLLLSGIVMLNKNLQDRLFILNNFEASFAQFKLYEPRVIIWPCAYTIASEDTFNSLTGLASEEVLNQKLAVCYDHTILNKHRANFYITAQLNTHNQFIGSYMTSGLIGFLFLAGFFVIQIWQGRKFFFKTAIIVSLLLFLMVENVFYRQLGMYLFVLAISLITIKSKSEYQ